jgi:hypothetical protein
MIERRCEHCGKAFWTSACHIRKGHGRYCSLSCAAKARKRPLADRFWEKVNKSVGPRACWNWTGTVNPKTGYGEISGGERGSGREIASRLSWQLHYGPIPDGLCVLHHCDNRLCVNPVHLFLGTRADNVHDMIQKGRNADHVRPGYHPKGDRNGARVHPERMSRGERHHSAKLTEARVRAIRAAYAGGVCQAILSREYGVTPTCVYNIVHRKTWRHI